MNIELKKLIKDKRFLNELSAILIKEIIESGNLEISEKYINKRVKEIFEEMLDSEQYEELIDN